MRSNRKEPGHHARLERACYLLLLWGAMLMPNESRTTNAPFDGRRFSNLEPFADKKLSDIVKWKLSSRPARWPAMRSYPAEAAPLERSAAVTLRVINHATALVQLDGLNVITDPIFSERASPVSFAGPKRARPPGTPFEQLPPIDVVLISHDHYDHMDLPSLRRLEQQHRPLVLTGLGNEKRLRDAGLRNVKEMDWWQRHAFGSLCFDFVPAQHWSARGLGDRFQTLWGGFYISGTSKVYFAGDTGFGEFFGAIRKRLSAPDWSLLPIGAYEPRWFMRWAHMNPEDAVRAFDMLGTARALGIHFETFQLTDEAFDAPRKELQEQLVKYGIDPERFIAPVFGRAYGQ